MKKLLFVAVVMSSFGIANGMLDNLVLQSHVGNGSVELTHIKERIKQKRICLLEQHCEYVINELPMLSNLQQEQVVPMLKSAQCDMDAFTFDMPEYRPRYDEAASVLNQDQYSHLKAKLPFLFSEAAEPWLELIKSRCRLIQDIWCLQINSNILERISAGENLYSKCKEIMELNCGCLLEQHCEYVINELPMLSYLQQQQAVPMLKLIQCTLTAMLAAASGNSSLQEHYCSELEKAQSILTQEQYFNLGMEETSPLSETEPWLRMIEVRCSLVGILNQQLHKMLDLGISL